MTQKDFMQLREEYGDVNFVDKLQKSYIYEDNRVSKKAKKVARFFRDKYGDKQVPYHYLLEKVGQYQKKYKFSDAVFSRFQEIIENELIGSKSKEVLIPATRMMKVLGYMDVTFSKNNAKALTDIDARSIQEILKLNSNPVIRDKHRQVIMQSHTYKLNNLLINDKSYRPELGDSNTGPLVHPVIAALFIQKIPIIDSHFLHSSLANIIDCRFNNKNLQYITDIKLFNALIRDPNDILCNSESPYADLLGRVKIQHCLWETVSNFRDGRFYRVPAFNMLLQELELCNLISNGEKASLFGNTDGTILKRLLNAFSFRPTVLFHMPREFQPQVVFNTNPFQQIIRPVVTNTSLIHLKPPIQFGNMNRINQIKLEDALKQAQLSIEHGKMVSRETHISFSNGVVFFYVDRRQTKFYDTKLKGPTFPFDINYSGVPYSVMHTYDTLNNIEVIADNIMTINNKHYRLLNVVIAETLNLESKKEVIINSSLLFSPNDDDIQMAHMNRWVRYDPIGLNNDIKTGSAVNTPFGVIIENRSITNPVSSNDLISTKGIIYIYESLENSTGNIIN
jgi:hypothetical protein